MPYEAQDALWSAASGGELAKVQEALAAGAEVNTSDKDGGTALTQVDIPALALGGSLHGASVPW